MIVRIVFNEPHDLGDAIPKQPISDAQVNILALPSEGHRIIVDGVSYIVAAVNHTLNRFGSAPEYTHGAISILLDRADK